MLVKKIEPKELPTGCMFRMNYLYHTELREFVVIADRKEEILFVNRRVPPKDIEGFLEVVEFPHYAVAETKTKTGEFLKYVYSEYGSCAYFALMDAHSWYMNRKAEKKAKENAKSILPIIEKEVNSETPVVKYDENLMFEIWKAGNELNRKTAKNIISYGSIYEFYFGYLMGAGLLKDNNIMA